LSQAPYVKKIIFAPLILLKKENQAGKIIDSQQFFPVNWRGSQPEKKFKIGRLRKI